MNFLPCLIAKRFLSKSYQNKTVLLLSLLSKIGIAISIFALILSLSALNGFQKLIQKNLLSSLPHGLLISLNSEPLNWKVITKKINLLSNIIYSEPYILKNGILLKNNDIKFIHIKSFKDKKYLSKYFLFTKKKYHFNNVNFQKNEIVISSDLSKELLLKEGDWINLIILEKNIDIQKYNTQHFSFKIKAIFNAHGILNSNIGLIPFIFFQKQFHISNNIQAIELYMSNPFKADETVFNISKNIKDHFFIYTWMNIYKSIYHDIQTVKFMIYIILTLLITISFFSVISISCLSISRKTKEIAILRSMGANNFLIQAIFLYYGMRSIVIGNILGLIGGSIVSLNFNKIIYFLEKNFKNNFLLNNIFFDNFLSLELNKLDIITIFSTTIIIGIIANYYPAYYASKIDPIKILKEY